jgi:hypothetical protein
MPMPRRINSRINRFIADSAKVLTPRGGAPAARISQSCRCDEYSKQGLAADRVPNTLHANGLDQLSFGLATKLTLMSASIGVEYIDLERIGGENIPGKSAAAKPARNLPRVLSNGQAVYGGVIRDPELTQASRSANWPHSPHKISRTPHAHSLRSYQP